MIDNQPQGRGFFATIPGILTALAAVLTAATGLFLGIHGKVGSQEEDHRNGQAPVVVNLPPSGQSAPADNPAVDPAEVRVSNAANEVGAADPADQDLVTSCEAGDLQACIDLLDGLAQECEQGNGLSCDALFLISPEDSDYEAFGATCGGRFEDYSMAGACEEQ